MAFYNLKDPSLPLLIDFDLVWPELDHGISTQVGNMDKERGRDVEA